MQPQRAKMFLVQNVFGAGCAETQEELFTGSKGPCEQRNVLKCLVLCK